MHVVIIQNAKHEPAGFIEELLKINGISYEYIHAYESNEVPSFKASHIIILGGPMGVYECKEYPQLVDEMEIIRKAIKENVPLLGICLGAQLIAYALDKSVYPFREEVGWFEVFKAEDDEFNEGMDRIVVFQYHNDTFELPDGAKLIFRGDRVKNQGFRIGNCVGLQFHVEMTEELVDVWTRDLEPEKREKIMSEIYRVRELNSICYKLLSKFINLG